MARGTEYETCLSMGRKYKGIDMKKVGYNRSEQDMYNENEKAILRMIDMFQMEFEEANDLELAALATILLEAGANYSISVRKLRQAAQEAN